MYIYTERERDASPPSVRFLPRRRRCRPLSTRSFRYHLSYIYLSIYRDRERDASQSYVLFLRRRRRCRRPSTLSSCCCAPHVDAHAPSAIRRVVSGSLDSDRFLAAPISLPQLSCGANRVNIYIYIYTYMNIYIYIFTSISISIYNHTCSWLSVYIYMYITICAANTN